jgi:hypothetical protein
MRYNSIKRLYEADDIQQMPAIQQAPEVPQMPPAPIQSQIAPLQPMTAMMDEPMEPEKAATSMEEMPSFSQEMQPALPEADVMNLTVKELIERCKKINPLICMGLEQFVELNKDQIMSMTTGEAEPSFGDEPGADALDTETDLTFSKQIEPQAAEFSLDQPEADLEFPTA